MSRLGRWHKHKQRLAKKGLLSDVFLTLHKVSFKGPKAAAASSFEPLLVTRNAQRLSELVDRCLAMRKDIRELEILAYKAGADYDLFQTTSPIDEQIDLLRLQVSSKTNDKAGYDKAVGSFATNSTLEDGLSEISKGRSDSLAADLQDSAAVSGLTQKRWKALHAYQDAYNSRYTTPGNAHNYGERAKLLLKVIDVLMQEALARASALARGIQGIYGVAVAAPPPSVDLYSLDDFAVSTLATLQSLSHAAEQETISEIIIPLVQPWLPSQVPLINDATFTQAVKSASSGKPFTLSFTLNPDNWILDPNARLKGIGLSFGNGAQIVGGSGIDRNQVSDAFTRLTVRVETPTQTEPNGETYSRPPLLLGNVGLHGPGGPSAAVEGTSVENLSPFGTWLVTVHPLLVWKDGAKQLISDMSFSDPVKDLKLVLKFYCPGRFQ